MCCEPPDALAEFIAGLVAAEATFVCSEVRSTNGIPRPTFTFAVALGALDGASCLLLQSFFGVGQVRTYPRRRPDHDDETVFALRSIPDLIGVVVPFMDEHLPPSHKRTQYLEWREQLLAYDRVRGGRRRRSGGTVP